MFHTESPVRLIAAMCAAEILSMAGMFSFPALLPMFLEEWGLSNTEAGWINGIYFAGYTLAVPILGSLTDRIDARRIYLCSASIVAIASLGFCSVVNGFWTSFLFRAIGGLGLAGTFIPGLKVLVDRLLGSAQVRAVAFYTAAFGVGTSLSFFAAGELGARFGWRWAFAFGAATAVLATILVSTAISPLRPRTTEVTNTPLLDFRPVLRNRGAMAYILAYAAHTWELFAVRSWIVTFLSFSLSLQGSAKNHWSPTAVFALATLVAMAGHMGGAELAVRFGRRQVLTLIMGGSALFAFGIGFTAALSYPVVVALCILYTTLVQSDSGALHAGTILAAEAERRGVTMAVQSLFGFASAAAAPLAVGVVLDITGRGQGATSWGMAFITMGVVVALGPVFLKMLGKDISGTKARPLATDIGNSSGMPIQHHKSEMDP